LEIDLPTLLAGLDELPAGVDGCGVEVVLVVVMEGAIKSKEGALPAGELEGS
jgi:hypothetical protein